LLVLQQGVGASGVSIVGGLVTGRGEEALRPPKMLWARALLVLRQRGRRGRREHRWGRWLLQPGRAGKLRSDLACSARVRWASRLVPRTCSHVRLLSTIGRGPRRAGGAVPMLEP